MLVRWLVRSQSTHYLPEILTLPLRCPGAVSYTHLKAPEDGEWQHFLFVYSDKGLPGSPELRAKLYVNGELKTTEGSVGSRFYNSSNYANYNAPMTAFGRYMRTSDNLFEMCIRDRYSGGPLLWHVLTNYLKWKSIAVWQKQVLHVYGTVLPA